MLFVGLDAQYKIQIIVARKASPSAKSCLQYVGLRCMASPDIIEKISDLIYVVL